MFTQIIDLSFYFKAVIPLLGRMLAPGIGIALGIWLIKTALNFFFRESSTTVWVDDQLLDLTDEDDLKIYQKHLEENGYYDRVREELNPSDYGAGDWASKPYDNDDLYE